MRIGEGAATLRARARGRGIRRIADNKPRDLQVEPGVVVRRTQGRGTVVLGDHIKLYRDVQLLLFGPHASITIGDGTFINWSTDVVCREAVTIGAGCAIGWRVIITDSDFHELAGGRPPTATVTIADHVWVGAGSIILKGVTVGEGAVVAAGAVVTADVAPGSIVAGNPAREIRSGVTWRGLT